MWHDGIVLQELVLESEQLKIHLEERSLLDKVLKKCIDWERDASLLLQTVEKLWNMDIIGDGITSCFISELESQVLSIESAMQAGLSLGLELTMIPKLQDACSMLKWFIKALSFSFLIPTSEVIFSSRLFTNIDKHMFTCFVIFSLPMLSFAIIISRGSRLIKN